MKIKELYIENFGKLSSFRLNLEGGLNTVIEDNGFGKTTLSVFIKAMLYGLDDSKRTSIFENDRKHYLPWNSGTAGGWLTFETGSRSYRVERSFAPRAADDTFAIYDLKTGKSSANFGERLGEELFGIDADGFERTVFLSEKNLSGKNDNQTISAKLSDLVGVDGDIGGFDDAIKRLEEKRKYYQKRGGGGEIGNLKARLEDAEAQILRLDLIDEKISERRAENETITKKISELTVKRKELDELGEKELEQIKRQEYERQYAEMNAALNEDLIKEREAELFFKTKLPTFEEINAADEAAVAAKRAEVSASYGKNEKYEALAEFFADGATYEEIEDASRSAAKLEQLRLISGTTSPLDTNTYIPFVNTPTVEQINEYSILATRTDSTGKKSVFSILPSGLAALAMLIAGISLGVLYSPIFLALSALGAIGLCVCGIAIAKLANATRKDKRLSEVDAFIRSVYGDSRTGEDRLSTLISMRAELERYNADLTRAKADEEAKRAVISEAFSLEDALCSFADRFPLEKSLSVITRVAIIKEKFTRFTYLRESERLNQSAHEKALSEAVLARSRYEEFIGNFPTITENPTAEIRTRLTEYLSLRSGIARQRAALNAFAERHKITGDIATAHNTVSSADTRLMIKAADEELLSLRSELHRGETEIERLESEAEKIDLYVGIKQDCEEKIALYTERFEVINKTKELLQAAKNNMTAKYLDGTRSGFEKYMSIIDGSTDEYGMDTSFSVMKSDAGALRHSDMYSKGTRDLFALAVRLALIDALYEGEMPPLILDDPFSAFDDKRCERALALIKRLSKDRQIIYLTCSKARYIR